MGCVGSKKSGLNLLDDSVHVMLKHDKKVQQKKGEPIHGYKPRAEHPLLKPKAISTSASAKSSSGGDDGGAVVSAPAPATDEGETSSNNNGTAVTAAKENNDGNNNNDTNGDGTPETKN